MSFECLGVGVWRLAPLQRSMRRALGSRSTAKLSGSFKWILYHVTLTPLGFRQIDNLVDLGRRDGTEPPYVVVSRATSLNALLAFRDPDT